MLRDTLHRIYWQMKKVIVPRLRYHQSVYEEILTDLVRNDEVWLELGCGHQILSPWRLEQEQQLVAKAKSVVGVDLDSQAMLSHRTIKNLVCEDITRTSFPADTFSLVSSNMVLEHVEHPEALLREVFRVLQPGGRFLFHTPNANSLFVRVSRLLPDCIKKPVISLLENRSSDDVYPTYYRLNRIEDIERLAQSAGFKVSAVRFLVSPALTAVIPPLAFFELLLMRIMMTQAMKRYRTTLIAILEKPQVGQALGV